MTERQFRNKIHWFTFLFSILVIWVHSYNSELYLGKTPMAVKVYGIENFIGNTVSQIAVPGFFMISAYLFYRNFQWERLLDKWSSRIRSILVPYIVWNGLYYLGYLIAGKLPVITDLVGRGEVPFSLKIVMEAIVFHTYNPVFWYLFQLILLIALAPFIYAILKNKVTAFLYIVVLLFAVWFRWELPELNMDALLYYSAAAYAAIHHKDTVESSWTIKRGIMGGIICVIMIWLHMQVFQQKFVFVTVMYRLLVPAALWMAIDARWLCHVKPWMKENFFLYAVHFAIVRFINKTGARIFLTPAAPLIIFLIMPAISVTVSFYVGRPLKTHIPWLWKLLNGSR